MIGEIFPGPLVLGVAPTPLPGWHVNVTPEVVDARPELKAFVVTPSALRRVWSGDDPTNPVLTVALRFENEAEALAYFPAA
jgi:hypothetical protein